jgi:acetate kinase
MNLAYWNFILYFVRLFMNCFIINCGSSSLKADVVHASSRTHLWSTIVERIGEPKQPPSHREALGLVLEQLQAKAIQLDAVGHRVVHGGEEFRRPQLIDDVVYSKLEKLVQLAPLHLPANLAGIHAARAHLSQLPHIAVFDTAFHATLPARAKRYAFPTAEADALGIRRYGFHGPSHSWVAREAARYLKSPIEDLKLITCHLGNGASATAIEFGRSIETSMGMTPLEGLVMGTRTGDIDVGAALHYARAKNLTLDELDRFLNRDCGLLGLSGISNDMRDIEEEASSGNPQARRAIQVFTHRLRKYIGSYAAVMGGVDAIVFTGGIGENSAAVRHRSCQRLGFLGALIDEDKNRDIVVHRDEPVHCFSLPHSRCHLLVVKTDEALSIAGEVTDAIQHESQIKVVQKIPLAISARHIHLTKDALEALFGKGYQLTERNPLSQPGQYACEETLTVVGPKNRIENVRILGPLRPRCQVEISRTDEFHIGVDAPVRCSGHVKDTPGIKLIGPKGQLTLNEGLIQAQRHIHMTPEDAVSFGVKDKEIVEVAISSEEDRNLIFDDVIVRVSKKYRLEMHIDTDEANAAGVTANSSAELHQTPLVIESMQRR